MKCDAVVLTLIPSIHNHTEDYLRYAHGLISEYISEDLSKALLKHLQYVHTLTILSFYVLMLKAQSRITFM